MCNRHSSSRSPNNLSSEVRSATSHRSPGQPAGPHLHSRQDKPKPLNSAANQAGAAVGRSPDLLRAYELIQAGQPLPSIQERRISSAEETKVTEKLDILRSKTADKYARAGHRAEGTPHKLMAVLRASSIKKQDIGFSENEAMQGTFDALSKAVRREAPINLILPLGGGKVANPLKTGDAYLPDLSEHGAAMMLAAIADAIRELYAPGAHIFQLPDAGLHTEDLGMSATEHQLHLRKLQEDLRSLGINDQVSMVDTLANIPDEWVQEVQTQTHTTGELVAKDPVIAADIEGQVQSLRYSMNLRVLGWSYEDIVLAMAALEFPDLPGLPSEAKERALTLLTRTREVALRYAGTNRALRSLDLPARVMQKLTGSPDYVRLTVHAKKGEPRPALVPSSGLARPGLLPMHGLGVLDWRDDKVRLGAFFHLEARMRGFGEVKNAAGRTLFYETPPKV